jgi:predicted transcriptional regulator
MPQGLSSRETCSAQILKVLLEKKELSFEEILSTVDFSRGTVSKYLTELFNAEFITRKGRRGKYFLTEQGKKETIKRFGELNEQAFNNYMRTIVQIAQEGHAKILTKKQIEKINNPMLDIKKLPSTLDEEGMRRIGIKDSQIPVIKMLEEAVNNLAKNGYRAAISVKGEKDNYWIVGRKKPKKYGVIDD